MKELLGAGHAWMGFATATMERQTSGESFMRWMEAVGCQYVLFR